MSDIFTPIPEYFVPDPDIAGWMRGSNGIKIKGERWQTLALYRVLLEQYVKETQELRHHIGILNNEKLVLVEERDALLGK